MSLRYDPVVNRLADDPRCVSCQMKHCFSCEHKGPPLETQRKVYNGNFTSRSTYVSTRTMVKSRETNTKLQPKNKINDEKPKKGCC